jgi:hypothetical protein
MIASVHGSAHEAGDQAKREANRDDECFNGQGDAERDARAVDEARK